MSIPDFQTLMLPVLKAAYARKEEGKMQDIADVIANQFHLTERDLDELLPSGKQTTFLNRLQWAKTYLQKAGLLESPRRGFFKTSERGNSVILENPDRIDMKFLTRFEEYKAWQALVPRDREDEMPASIIGDLNPEESIVKNFDILNRELLSELIQKVHTFTPYFFERLIVDLLIAMGYGDGRAEMGKALGRSGDGGIDGVIKEDELGLDAVYVQAKRYDPDGSVPIGDVRDFVGSLEGHKALKGVFVTTSKFPKSAYEYVGRVSKRVILIDGSELSKLMMRHNVGVRIRDIYEIKKIDEDYFVE
jgi:restriction system protein